MLFISLLQKAYMQYYITLYNVSVINNYASGIMKSIIKEW